MRPEELIDHDLHVHTTLSACCSDPQATPENILARAAQQGLRTIAFTDHLWDGACPGASSWYKPQDVDHVLQIRNHDLSCTENVRAIVGCESEYAGNGKVGLSPKTKSLFDWVLLPMSHLHMRGFVLPDGVTESTDIAALMVHRFQEVLDLNLADGIAHPFLPCGHLDRADEILGFIPDHDFRACFDRAAEHTVSIEITTAFFPSTRGQKADGLHDETFLRILSLAKQCGCVFHLASDAHSLKGIGQVHKLAPFLGELGLQRDDFAPILDQQE